MSKLSAGEIRLLCIGDARIETSHGSIDPSASVLFATALYLLLENTKPVSRTVLGDLLWPDASPEVRMHRLRQTLLKLRRAGVLLRSGGRDLSIKVEDARRYARLVFDQELHDRLLMDVLNAPVEAPGKTLFNVLAKQEAETLLASSKEYF